MKWFKSLDRVVDAVIWHISPIILLSLGLIENDNGVTATGLALLAIKCRLDGSK